MSVHLDLHGGVACVTIHRPAARNALDFNTMDALARVVAGLASSLPRAVVVTGGGGRFIAGGDLKALAHHPTWDDGHRLATEMQRTLIALAALPCPVIAAVDRDALGGGAELLLACDLVVAAADARFSFRQVHLGLTTAWGGARRLRDRVGRACALRLLWTGCDVTAGEALQLGLIDQLAPTGSGLAAALALAAELAAHPPQVTTGFKRLLDDSGLDEAALFADTWAGEPHLRAVQRWLSRPATQPENEEP